MNVELKTKQSRIYINGEWVGEDLGELQVLNPANSKVVGSVPNGGEKETNEAIEAAHEAFKTWSKTTAYERAGYLEKLHALMLENQ